MNWQFRDAKRKFSQVVKRALEDGPQVVTRHGKEVVVILSMDDYQKMVEPKRSLLEILMESPLQNSGFETERDKEDFGRELAL